ncbi:MAG: HlyD family secretion protein [Psychromonas sp.]|nr:HlyD family secretion protein [Psychromonas sp.]
MMKNNKLLLLVGLAIGIIILIVAVKFKTSPEPQASIERARLVEVTTLKKQNVAPQVIGFGRVTPKHSWQAIAEVSGKLIYRNPLLEAGRLLTKDTLLLEIDPLEYQLNLAQAEANLNASKAKLQRIDQEQKNVQNSLQLEEQKLQLIEQEYTRQQVLKKKKLVSDSTLENSKQQLLAQQTRVQDLQSALQLLPDDRQVTMAQVRIEQSKVAESRRKLSKTKLRLPYDAKISDVNIAQDQIVSLGSVMLSAYQLDAIEIKIELSLADLKTLINSVNIMHDNGSLPSIENLPFTATVSLQMAADNYHWPAKVTRIAETVSPEQATIGVYLEVQQDYRKINPALKPPLTKGMFVSATISGATAMQYVVPEKALHENRIYLINTENRLVIKPIKVLYRTEQGVIISADIDEGANLVVNDLIPAIDDMLLKPVAIKEKLL